MSQVKIPPPDNKTVCPSWYPPTFERVQNLSDPHELPRVLSEYVLRLKYEFFGAEHMKACFTYCHAFLLNFIVGNIVKVCGYHNEFTNQCIRLMKISNTHV